jgi:hypothetical protein
MARKGPITEFGRTLRDLGEEGGANSWQAITDRLNEVGWEGSRATLSNWAHGRYQADHEMLPYFVEAFDLSDEERQRLANAFAYGQGFNVGTRSA